MDGWKRRKCGVPDTGGFLCSIWLILDAIRGRNCVTAGLSKKKCGGGGGEL